jgi:plasmid stabilization system protein ParE
MKVKIMPAAEADLIGIRDYIREQNPNAARGWPGASSTLAGA